MAPIPWVRVHRFDFPCQFPPWVMRLSGSVADCARMLGTVNSKRGARAGAHERGRAARAGGVPTDSGSGMRCVRVPGCRRAWVSPPAFRFPTMNEDCTQYLPGRAAWSRAAAGRTDESNGSFSRRDGVTAGTFNGPHAGWPGQAISGLNRGLATGALTRRAGPSSQFMPGAGRPAVFFVTGK